MESAVSIAFGIGLSAACGFRIFVPLLILGIAAYTGNAKLSSGFEWIGSLPALIAFATATAVEILAYFIPWLDHLLDTIATPAAVCAGILVSASAFAELSPMFRWVLALIAGGGIAGLVQGATVLARIQSTAFTGGLGNPLVSAMELLGSVAASLLALLVPLLCAFLIIVGLCLIFFWRGRLLFGKKRTAGS
jgi:hypothetical protein